MNGRSSQSGRQREMQQTEHMFEFGGNYAPLMVGSSSSPGVGMQALTKVIKARFSRNDRSLLKTSDLEHGTCSTRKHSDQHSRVRVRELT